MSSRSESFVINALSHDFNGISKRNNKACFINDCLPGEEVSACALEQKRKFERWQLLEISTAHPQRTEPKCRYFGECGGCDFQYAEHALQQNLKAEKVVEQVQRFAKTTAGNILPSSLGEGWGYRRKARLATWLNKKMGYYELGFRAAKEKRLVAIDSCLVLEPELDGLLQPLQQLLIGLGKHWRLGHIDLLLADYLDSSKKAFVIMRVSDKQVAQLEPSCTELLQQFQTAQGCVLLLQLDSTADEAVFYPIEPSDASADVSSSFGSNFGYSLPAFNLQLDCAYEDFLQANTQVNRQMVQLAIDQLELDGQEVVAEFFAGMGNFSLALAQSVKQLSCFEGSEVLIERLEHNARANGLTNIDASVQNLMAEDLDLSEVLAGVDKVLLDPPRDGAQVLCQQLIRKGKKPLVKRIVYISCNPSSLARDAALLCEKAYKLSHLGLIDLFPQTRHMEAIAVFEAKK